MQLRNNTVANLGVRAVTHPDTRAQHTHLIVPGEGTIYLDDEQWKNHFLPECDKLLAAGNLEIVEAVIESDDEVQKRELAEYEIALALVKKHKEANPEPKAKAEAKATVPAVTKAP